MKFQLVLQFHEENEQSFERLISLEESLEQIFKDEHDIDGHDFGSGEMNLFVHTNDPKAAFAVAKNAVLMSGLSRLEVGYRRLDGENYIRIWPVGSNEVFKVA